MAYSVCSTEANVDVSACLQTLTSFSLHHFVPSTSSLIRLNNRTSLVHTPTCAVELPLSVTLYLDSPCQAHYLQDLAQDDETQQEQHGLLDLLVRRVQEARLRYQTRTYLSVSNALLTNARTAQQRLGNESMRRFDACALCLQRARDPVACQKGHLFCRECVLTDLGALTG